MTADFDAYAFATGCLNAWNRRDEAALRGTNFAPQVVYREVALRETLTGIDAVIGCMRHLAATSPDVRREMRQAVAESPDKLAIQWMSRRTIKGAAAEAEGMPVMHRQDGRIVHNAGFRHRGS